MRHSPYREALRRDADASLIWEGHKAGRHIGYCHLEKLHNLEALPSTASPSVASRTKIRARLGRLDPGGCDLRRVNDP